MFLSRLITFRELTNFVKANITTQKDYEINCACLMYSVIHLCFIQALLMFCNSLGMIKTDQNASEL